MATCATLVRLYCASCANDTLHSSSRCVHCGKTQGPVTARTLVAHGGRIEVQIMQASRKRGNAKARALKVVTV